MAAGGGEACFCGGVVVCCGGLEAAEFEGLEFDAAALEGAALESGDFDDRSKASELGGICGGGDGVGSGVFSLTSSGVTRSTAIGLVATEPNG